MVIDRRDTLIEDTHCMIPPHQRRTIRDLIHRKGDSCNMLVFGVGGDTVLWNSLNTGHTQFIEHDEDWARLIAKQNPMASILQYKFRTKCDPLKPIQEQPEIDENELATFPMPSELTAHKWDIILIDGPSGFDDACPGRMLPIYWSSLISDNTCDIFVDDYSRPIEFIYANKFLFHRYSKFHLYNHNLQMLWLKGQ